jgi:hypothetical protein
VRIPDSDVAVAASALVKEAAPPFLFTHCLQTFLLGMIDVGTRALRVDDEVAFVGSILHDLALLPKYAGDLNKSFEENGADLPTHWSGNTGFPRTGQTS